MSETTPHVRSVNVGESGLGPYGQIVVAGRHVLGADEAERLGGRDTGPDPYEYLCVALGACTSMTIRMYAARKGWPLTRVSVTVTHAKTAAVPGTPATDAFHRIIVLEGGLDADQRRRLLEIANKCPVHATLTAGAGIASELAPT